MLIEKVNEVLLSEAFSNFILQSFQPSGRELTIAFTSDGGPMEDQAFLVTFNDAVIFHLPSVLYAPLVFKILQPAEAVQYIPEVSFDTEEFSENGFRVVLLTDYDGSPYGYYIAAKSVTANWVAREKCVYVW